MSKLNNIGNFELDDHNGDDAILPCFSCFLEGLMEAAEEVAQEEGPAAFDLAIADALRQMADGVGTLLALLTPDTRVLCDAFITRMNTTWLENIETENKEH